MNTSASFVVRSDNIPHRDVSQNHQPSKLKTYGFVIAIIVGIGGLAIGGAGLASYFHVGGLVIYPRSMPLIMMAAGGVAIVASPLFGSLFLCGCKKKRVFNKVDAIVELEKNVDIKFEEVKSEIDINMSFIQKKSVLCKEEKEGMKFYTSSISHRVFELASTPGFIFKMEESDPLIPRIRIWDATIDEHYNNTIKAKITCLTHQLELLVIPDTKLIRTEVDSKECPILIQKKLEIDHDIKNQKNSYLADNPKLDEAIRQLAIFICETGFSDVDYRNIPLLENSVDKDGNRKIALFDLEEMRGASIGIFGAEFSDGRRRGLLDCVSQRQRPIVEAIARQYKVKTVSQLTKDLLSK